MLWRYTNLASRERRGHYVFCRADGSKYDGGWLSHRFKKYVRKAGLPEEIHFHSLRHTGVSWLMNKGVPAPYVQKLVGHRNLSVTGIYTHYEDANLASAVQAFESFSQN